MNCLLITGLSKTVPAIFINCKKAGWENRKEESRAQRESAYLEYALEISAIVESLAKYGSQFAVEIRDRLVELGTVLRERLVVRLEGIVRAHGERHEQMLELLVHVHDPRAQRSALNPAYFYFLQLGEFHHGVEQPLDIVQSSEKCIETGENSARIEGPRWRVRFHRRHVFPPLELPSKLFQHICEKNFFRFARGRVVHARIRTSTYLHALNSLVHVALEDGGRVEETACLLYQQVANLSKHDDHFGGTLIVGGFRPGQSDRVYQRGH